MTEPEVEQVGDVEETGKTDVDLVLILVGLAIGIGFVLALVFDYKTVASIGVGEFSAFTNPVDSFFNGLGTLISSFFTGLGKRITSSGLWIMASRTYYATIFYGVA